MDKSITTILNLYNNYSNSNETIAYLNEYIANELPQIIDKKYNININNNKNNKHIQKYIKNFLSNQERQLFYLNKSDIYVIYNNINFNVISEDKIYGI